MNLVGQAAVLVAFPVLASIVGAVIAAVRPPGPRTISGVQHFAAGVVMAALVGEIMPELRKEGHLEWTVVGFAAGTALVLALGAYGRHTEAHAAGEIPAHKPRFGSWRRQAVAAAGAKALPIGMLGAVAVDLLLDGVLVGLGVRLGTTQGVILTIALTLEILFLGLSVVSELHEGGMAKTHAVMMCIGLGLTTAVGAIGAALLLGDVSTSIMSAVLAFGAAALLYLVVEELLVEAHEERESVWLGAMFFLGFIVIYVLASLEM
ncbi:MAG TPA: ZIP family metal transporter [Dermatophilaceae bacterium]|jgi:ZIP family zinc transporter|nr:ZIP family metal transporter [Dermatophilaceae bacterium]